MKKILLAVVAAAVIIPALAFARTHHRQGHNPKPVPVIATSTAPTSTPVVPPPSTIPPLPTSTKVQWGAFTGGTTASLNTFSTLVGKQPNLVGVFIGDGDSFTSDFSSFFSTGKTLVVYWESNLTAKQIANGSADTFVSNWAKQIKAYGGPVVLAPLDEMNGDWSAYNGDPINYKAAWIRVHNLFAGVTNVKFAYTVNNTSEPDVASNGVTIYYPGDAYVDIVGIDGFNGYLAWGGPSLTWNQVFVTNSDGTLPRFKSAFPNKPIWIMSTASCQGTTKPTWINQMGTGIQQYGIQGWVWFNVNKECNWTVNSDPASLAAFKTLINQ